MNSSARSDANESDIQVDMRVGGPTDPIELAEQELILQNFFRNPNNYLNNISSNRPGNSHSSSDPPNHESSDQKQNQKTPQEALLNVIRNNLIIQIVFLTSILHLAWRAPFWLIFVVIWLYDISVIKNCLSDILLTNSAEVKRLSWISIAEYLFLILFKAGYSVCIITSLIPFVLPVCVMIGVQIGKILLIIFLKFKEEKPLLRESGETCFKMFLLIQILLVSLKLDKILSWSWKEVFWIYWVFFSVMLGINIGFVIILLGKLYQKCHSNIKSYRLKGVFWVCFLVTGITVNSCLFVTSIIDYLQDRTISLPSIAKLIVCLAFVALYIIMLVGFTAMFYHDILIFFEKIDVDEDEDEEDEIIANLQDEYLTYNQPHENGMIHASDRNNDEQTLKRKKRAKKKIKKKKLLPDSIPMILTKFSSTYYKVTSMLTPNLNEKETTKKKKKDPAQKHELVYTEPTYTASQIFSSSRSAVKQKPVSSSQNDFLQYLNQLKIGQETNSYRGKCYEFNTKMLPTSEYMTSCTDRRVIEDPSESSALPSVRSDIKLISKDSNRMMGGVAEDMPIGQKSNELEKSGILDIKDDSFQLNKKSLRRNFSDPLLRKKIEPSNEANTNSQVFIPEVSNKPTPVQKDSSVSACLICFDKNPDAVFLDCGHGGLCYSCSLEIMEKTGECYLCRSVFKKNIFQEAKINEKFKKRKLKKFSSFSKMIPKSCR